MKRLAPFLHISVSPRRDYGDRAAKKWYWSGVSNPSSLHTKGTFEFLNGYGGWQSYSEAEHQSKYAMQSIYRYSCISWSMASQMARFPSSSGLPLAGTLSNVPQSTNQSIRCQRSRRKYCLCLSSINLLIEKSWSLPYFLLDSNQSGIDQSTTFLGFISLLSK